MYCQCLSRTQLLVHELSQCCLTVNVQLVKDRDLDDTSFACLHGGQALLWGGIIQLGTLRCKLLLLQCTIVLNACDKQTQDRAPLAIGPA